MPGHVANPLKIPMLWNSCLNTVSIANVSLNVNDHFLNGMKFICSADIRRQMNYLRIAWDPFGIS